jgi:hypothetical protein
MPIFDDMIATLQAVINTFDPLVSNLTVSEFVLGILKEPSLHSHPCTLSLVNNASNIIIALSQHLHSATSAFTWANETVKKRYIDSIKELTRNEDWHFNASHASAKDLEEFRIEDMALKMKVLAPDLWNILGLLLSGDRRSWRQHAENDSGGDHMMADIGTDGEDLWEGFCEPDDADKTVDENGTFLQLNSKKKADRQDAICTIICNLMIFHTTKIC